MKYNDKVILNELEISIWNESIKSKTNDLYDIFNISKLTKEDVLNYITKYNIPSLPKYDGKKEVTTKVINEILNNRNLSNIPKEIIPFKGLIVSRANLRSFPTNVSFYDNPNKQFDRIQESELVVNTPVIIIHESFDNKWYFVISPIYAGWVLKCNIALVKNEDMDYFINNPSFGVVIEPFLLANKTLLDMGVILPILNEDELNYQIILPEKGKDEYVLRKEILISKNKVQKNFLPYTKENVINNAYKYLNIPYKWGGKDDGVDCSSFILNIYKTFGFIFPRNVSSQNKSIGKIISLEEKSNKEKLSIIKNSEPSLIFKPGHVMLYIGLINNEPFIIHASGDELKVTLTKLKDTYYLECANKLVTITK